MTVRRTYKIDSIIVNDVRVSEVIIDPHYEEKHRSSVNDELILKLVRKLDGRYELPDKQTGPYLYFSTLVDLDTKQYRLIWLLEENAIYVGIVNAYRDRRKE